MPMMEHVLRDKLKAALGKEAEVEVEGVGQELSPVQVRVKHEGHEHVVKSTMSMAELVQVVVEVCKHVEPVVVDEE